MKIYPYLNFDGKAEAAFLFYRSIFGGEFIGGIQYITDAPGMEEIPEDEKNRVMHVCLQISPDLKIMASDTLPSMGHVYKPGNNNYISLDMESLDEAKRIYAGLSQDGTIEMELQKTFWGAYFASFTDQFGIGWMINYDLKPGEE